METENTKEFFEILGEIWRDITAIEFLMRCALSQNQGDISKIPVPPYTKGKIYTQYPKSFSYIHFGEVAQKFNRKFPDSTIPQELIDLRNAMAHGLICEVNNSGVDELIKFRENKDNTSLEVEFSMPLDLKRIRQIKQSIKELRQRLAIAAADKN